MNHEMILPLYSAPEKLFLINGLFGDNGAPAAVAAAARKSRWVLLI